MRVVLDTNVLVSGLLSPKGTPAILIQHWLNSRFTLLYTSAMQAEWEDVLKRPWLAERLRANPERIADLLDAVLQLGELVTGYVNVAGVVRDPFDEMFLACARLGHADYLISGDKALLELAAYEGTPIITPAQFLQILETAISKQ